MATSGTPNNNKSTQKRYDIGSANSIEYKTIIPNNHAYKTRTKRLEVVSVGTAESITARTTSEMTERDTIYAQYPTAGDAITANGVFFMAKENCRIREVSFRHSGNSTSGTATLYKAINGTAISGGTAMSNAADLTRNNDINRDITLLANTAFLKKGEVLGFVFAGTMTGLTGLVVSVLITRENVF